MSLWKKLERRRRRRPRRRWPRSPELTEPQILAWADQYHERCGRWPTSDSGRIVGSLGEKWVNVSMALRVGCRGLPGGSSLARLLAERRGVRNHMALPRFTKKQILAWADAYHRRHGQWPTRASGPICEAPAESWCKVAAALVHGGRGLPGGTTLAQLLAKARGRRNHYALPPLRPPTILAWADRHYRRHGQWPQVLSGPIAGAPGETWLAVENALRNGRRGLPGGSSLAQFLAEHRGVRNRRQPPRLSTAQILRWADAYRRRHGQWPHTTSGPLLEAPEEKWANLDHALREGLRGLPGDSSLASLLAERRAVRNPARLPRLTVKQILRWADAHHRRHGRWPQQHSGPVNGAPEENWERINAHLVKGQRGLPGGSSLAQLLAEQRGMRNRSRLPPLTPAQILRWAKAFHRRTGRWPSQYAGEIPGTPGETWQKVHRALYHGGRGLPGGSSLPRLLQNLKRS